MINGRPFNAYQTYFNRRSACHSYGWVPYPQASADIKAHPSRSDRGNVCKHAAPDAVECCWPASLGAFLFDQDMKKLQAAATELQFMGYRIVNVDAMEGRVY